MKRLLPFLLPIPILFLLFSYTPFKREVLYRAGYFNNHSDPCCTEAQVMRADGVLQPGQATGEFEGKQVSVPNEELASLLVAPSVLGEMTPTGEKWIEISLSKQLLTAWEGNKKFMEYKISSGKWGSTPVGTYNIWYKTRVQRMTGGSKELGTFYDLPNVPSNMFFYGSYGIHGAYWHNNFGNPMSHGCVNEPLKEAAQLFDWTGPNLNPKQNVLRASSDNPGTKVVIHT